MVSMKVVIKLVFIIVINWDSLHAMLNSHYTKRSKYTGNLFRKSPQLKDAH